jgi:hypothetical protein
MGKHAKEDFSAEGSTMEGEGATVTSGKGLWFLSQILKSYTSHKWREITWKRGLIRHRIYGLVKTTIFGRKSGRIVNIGSTYYVTLQHKSKLKSHF